MLLYAISILIPHLFMYEMLQQASCRWGPEVCFYGQIYIKPKWPTDEMCVPYILHYKSKRSRWVIRFDQVANWQCACLSSCVHIEVVVRVSFAVETRSSTWLIGTGTKIVAWKKCVVAHQVNVVRNRERWIVLKLFPGSAHRESCSFMYRCVVCV